MKRFVDKTTKLINELEKKRDSKVIVYFTGDRPGAGSQISGDAVRVIYDHLLDIGKTKKIDLFLYSRGGDVSVPWRILSMLREFCEEFNVIIPYKANSAATLLSLGADNIIMGNKAELGPIDPTLVLEGSSTAQLPQNISVEDVKSYLNFMKNRAGITDQMAISQNIAILNGQIGPLAIGQIERMDNHIRLVARKMFSSRNNKIDESKINSIIEVLTEKIYSHGHAIGRKEAKEMGLPIQLAEEEGIDGLVWNLYMQYENFLDLTNPLFPEPELGDKEEVTKINFPIALIQSRDLLTFFEGNIEYKNLRKLPDNPQINIALNLTLPPGVVLERLSEEQQTILRSMLDSLKQDVPRIVRESIIAQSPQVGIDIKFKLGKWVIKWKAKRKVK